MRSSPVSPCGRLLPNVFWVTPITSATFRQDVTVTDRIASSICELLTEFTPLFLSPVRRLPVWQRCPTQSSHYREASLSLSRTWSSISERCERTYAHALAMSSARSVGYDRNSSSSLAPKRRACSSTQTGIRVRTMHGSPPDTPGVDSMLGNASSRSCTTIRSN